MTDLLHVVYPHCHAVNSMPSDRLNGAGTCGKCYATLFTAHPVELDELNFDKHLTRSDLPIVVDFWAPWWAPCRSMAPSYAEAAQQLEPHYRLIKVNTEQNQNFRCTF